MMSTIRSLLLSSLCLFGILSAYARQSDPDFSVDGFCYQILSMDERTVSLVSEKEYHEGNVTVPQTVTYKGVSFAVESIGEDAFYRNNKLEGITFPENIKKIGESAFSGCQSLHVVTFSDSVKFIDYGAFSGCTSLTTITMPKYLQKVPDWCFSGCINLKDVQLQDSIKIVGDCAFNLCKKLEYLTFPDSLKVLGTNAFNDCVSLKEMRFPKSLKRIKGGTFQNCNQLSKIVFPDSMEYIGYSTFHSCKSLTEVVLPSSLPETDDNVFYQCTGLKKVKLPEDLKELSRQFFYHCTSLESVELPENLTMIDNGAFKGCSSLSVIEIPRKVRTIGSEAFWDCTKLSTIKIYAGNPPTIEARTFDLLNYSSATLYVPKGVKTDYQNADGWKEFSKIVEMGEAPVETYPLSITVGKGGALLFDKYVIRDRRFNADIQKAKTVQFKITPDEGYRIKSVKWNRDDVTGQLKDNTFTAVMESSANLSVEFEKLPVDLVIRQADNGCTRMHNAEGKSYTFSFEPAAGWRLNSVTFNGEEVTYLMAYDHKFRTPVIQFTSELNVTFESDNVSGISEHETHPVIVRGYDGAIHVTGAEQGTAVCVYSTDGAQLVHTTATSAPFSIPMKENAVYIVKVGQRTFKLAL